MINQIVTLIFLKFNIYKNILSLIKLDVNIKPCLIRSDINIELYLIKSNII